MDVLLWNKVYKGAGSGQMTGGDVSDVNSLNPLSRVSESLEVVFQS